MKLFLNKNVQVVYKYINIITNEHINILLHGGGSSSQKHNQRIAHTPTHTTENRA